MLNNAIEMLSKDFLLHVDMLECIRRGSAEILYTCESGALLLDQPSNIYMISANNYEVAEQLISVLPASIELIVSHDKFTLGLLSKKYTFSDKMTCYNAVYTKQLPIQSMKNIADIQKLTVGYIDIIMDKYSKAYTINSDYIRSRLEANALSGAFIHNTLCGFIGQHTEGSIGMLEVFPEYKGKGIGIQLEISAINEALSAKRYVYGQVTEDNLASMSLQKKLGLELSKNKVYWLMN